MTRDPLAARVRDAVHAFGVPAFPSAALHARLAASSTPARVGSVRRPATIAAAAAVLVAALAVAAPLAPPSRQFIRAVERLTGRHVVSMRAYDMHAVTLDEARRHTTFPIIEPRGMRVVEAQVVRGGRGVTLVVQVEPRGILMLNERWASDPPSRLEGVGIHDDGSIRRFNVRRWRIGRVALSVPMWDPAYHAAAERIEAATRAAARR